MSSTTDQPKPGSLVIEAPHWSAEVEVVDGVYEQVARGLGKLAVDVAPGLYRVRVALSGNSREEWVAVFSDRTTSLTAERWRLALESVVPFRRIETAPNPQTDAAIKWSRAHTTKGAGDSSLFVFIRALDPHKHPRFSEGLQLLDANGRLVHNLSLGAKLDSEAGWLAFHAKVPAGFYLLRRGRSGIRVRVQPAFLCPGWQTQCFLEAGSSPALRTLALNLAPLGSGFRPDDASAVAAQAVLAALGVGGIGARILESEDVKRLVEEKLENPWLGVLAAYAVRQKGTMSPSAADASATADSSQRLLARLLAFLADAIPAHPDARALQLESDRPAPQAFAHPPLLRAGLRLVQQHAVHDGATIPARSLTDSVIQNLLTDSPWTAWRRLADRTQVDLAARSWGRPRQPLEQIARAVVATTLKRVSPRGPVFRVAPFAGGYPVIEPYSPSDPPSSLVDASIIEAVSDLTSSVELKRLPEELVIDAPGEAFSKLLERADTGSISASVRLPRARTERNLAYLRREVRAFEKRGWKLNSLDDVFVHDPDTHYAPPIDLEEVVREAEVPDSAERARSVPPPAAPRPTSLEELAGRMRVEAMRLSQSDEETGRVRDIAKRLIGLAAELLTHADLTVLTTPEGAMTYCNGAFLDRLRLHDETARVARQASWEKALGKVAKGHSVLTDPTSPGGSWDLQHVALEGGDDRTARGFFSVLRQPGVQNLAPATLERIDSLLPSLSLLAPLVVGGVTSRRTERVAQLEQIVDGIESALRADWSYTKKPSEGANPA